MIKLYDTEKELFFDDYKPITGIINGLNCTEQIELLDNLVNALDNAYSYHSELLASALYNYIAQLKRQIPLFSIKTSGAGTIANYINSTKYAQIDKAINKTLLFLYNAENTELFPLQVNAEGIKNLVLTCYKNKDIYGT